MLIAVFVITIPALGLKSTGDVLKVIFYAHPCYGFAQASLCFMLVCQCTHPMAQPHVSCSHYDLRSSLSRPSTTSI